MESGRRSRRREEPSAGEGGSSRRCSEPTGVKDIVRDCSQDEARRIKFEDNNTELEKNRGKVNLCQQIIQDLFKTLPGNRSSTGVHSRSCNKRKVSSSEEESTARKKARVSNQSHSSTRWIEVSKLGQGSFGLVTLVKEQISGRLTARKTVRIRTEKDRNEFLIHQSLRHPNIIELVCVEVMGSNMNIYLEYAAKGDLADYIGPNGLGEFTALYFFAQLLEGVEYLHSWGIAHRDIKPGNLLLTEDRELKIADFGLSASFILNDKEVFLTKNCGTPRYRAPEVTSGRYRGEPADVWSCGITLGAILTGNAHWALACPEDSKYKNFLENPRSWLSGCSSQAVELVSHILKPDPKERATIAQIKESPWIKY
ncbi:serine/threonine-protein kinase Chk1-like [Oratosquilla oratoria]|uniref:serine/threonine-protein kinase Chk1-like n=1 Tax=Oratosquilla oratoria TaxID=337810 RepID=UPI003F76B098